ncbi:sulfite exporter TauE/SafE family protein [Duganella sp. FT50W]|uniref:Sulfite exporter TauE/SafE family protein n=1 Tax=Duganella lactea TaxID=2692173 RepID=A0A6L8MFY8_9BURK|nr:sulfite exporter TauE/SafE family protein [Duganella lactea]MYM32968.1 sulfite exporter TauE/SafE family protein [Duganella lactea]MYM80596.1 sulfite exporter TauE/SafE family protein [Duganella lactea]
MNAAQLLPVFVVGLAGSVHCAGMCGGIVTAMSAAGVPAQAGRSAAAAHRIVEYPLRRSMGSGVRRNADVGHVLAYNAGRIASYMTAGALAGGLAGGARNMAAVAGVQMGFYWLANLMLVALGLYLMNAWRGLATLEQGGRVLWQRAQPVIGPAMKTLMPADTAAKSFALGALWGWLPCGMVYSALTTAMLSSSVADGAAMMLAFGLGTLPMLTSLGLLGARVQRAMQRRGVRLACGLLVLAFGVIGLARAAGGVTPEWMDMLCLTPNH